MDSTQPQAKSGALSLRWKIFLLVALLVGIALRVIWPSDMEWKEDEYYNYIQSARIGREVAWPWVGMNSGVYLANPGMSIWIFVWLNRIFRVTEPTELATAVQIFALIGIALIVPFALKLIRTQEERKPWLWAYALAMVNPFLILFHRKLWPQPCLLPFSMLMWMGWWKREKAFGALIWGFFGAILGQIHMAGFFFAFALFLWTAFSESPWGKLPTNRGRSHWLGWFVGSVIGALPLIPWLWHLHTHPTGQPVSGGWDEIVQFKFWVFWVTDALGLHLGNPLGLNRGGSIYQQVSDFIRYPLIGGKATYLCGAAHLLALFSGVTIIALGVRRRWIQRRTHSQNPKTDTSVAIQSTLWGFGAIMTATGVNIRRYYLAASFPIEGVWIARLALTGSRYGKWLLLALWVAQALISAHFVGYIHVNQGSLQGDYGEAYHIQRDRHRAQTGESWPDLKLLRE